MSASRLGHLSALADERPASPRLQGGARTTDDGYVRLRPGVEAGFRAIGAGADDAGADVGRPDDARPAFTAAALTRTLGFQYLAGAALAALWLIVPPARPAHGRPEIWALAVLAAALGSFLLTMAAAEVPAVVLRRWSHLGILCAQVVVAAANAVTLAPLSPVLLFVLWTTPYAGVFSRRARWSHVAGSAAAVAAGSVYQVGHGVRPGPAAAADVAVIAAALVLTILVSRVSDALERQAMTDALTGLPNRRAFRAMTSAALAAPAAADSTTAMLLIDVDRFKLVNDTHGHHGGDALLSEIAGRLLAATGETESVARLGGDEFAVLCRGSSPQRVTEVANRLLATWAEPIRVGQGSIHVGASIGVALATRASTPSSLLRDADVALYRAKSRTPGRFQVFDPRVQATGQRWLELESGLRRALHDNDLDVHYQPVVSLTGSGPRIPGAEALVRWNHPALGPVSPDEFIPVAESAGLIVPLGLAVLGRAARDLSAWRAAGEVTDTFSVAVNVSAHQITDDLPEHVAHLLVEHDLPAYCLALELTESAVVRGAVADRVLRRLGEMGITLLLDDFGTGQSSLAQLHRFAFDVVKIDRSFVSGMNSRPTDRKIVNAIVSLAHALGQTVIAEGVEDAATEAALRALSCDAAQGWAYSAAVPAAQLTAVVRRLSLDDAAPEPETVSAVDSPVS